MNIIKIEELCIDAIKDTRCIILPILDKKCLSFFFDWDDMLLRDGTFNRISNLIFTYIEAREPRLCPTISCKIKYDNFEMNQCNNYFLYDEFISAEDSNHYLERIKNYCEYINSWLEINHKQAGGNLSFKQLFWFLEKIGPLDKYLIPKEDIVAYLDEKYSII